MYVYFKTSNLIHTHADTLNFVSSSNSSSFFCLLFLHQLFSCFFHSYIICFFVSVQRPAKQADFYPSSVSIVTVPLSLALALFLFSTRESLYCVTIYMQATVRHSADCFTLRRSLSLSLSLDPSVPLRILHLLICTRRTSDAHLFHSISPWLVFSWAND